MLTYQALFIVLLLVKFGGSNDVPEIQTEQGIVRGKVEKSKKGRLFNSFTGIPYAKPPVGELRFQPPIQAERWEGILDASKEHPICPQSVPGAQEFTVIGNEDCLFLNVYVPQLSETSLPVIFYIHGGSFAQGSGGPDWYGVDIIMDKNIVLATINYRLGALGFLSTQDEVVPGNNGLKDQVLALKWIKNNIAAFGGNPEKITVVGHSAGASCAHLLMVSPQSKDLIAGVIAQSLTALSAVSLSQNNENVINTKKLAEFLNCPTSSLPMIECLKKVAAEDIIKQEPKFVKWGFDPMIPFKPVVEPDLEGAFLSQHPQDIIKSGMSAKVPFVTGVTTEEGALRTAVYLAFPNFIQDLNKRFNELIPMMFYFEEQSDKEQISTKLREFYFGNKDIDESTKHELTKLFSDLSFILGTEDSVRLHAKYTEHPLYYYVFGYRGSQSYTELFGGTIDYGVSHADELLHLFRIWKEFPNFMPNETDEKMSEVWTSIWENFATTGNPTPTFSEKWEPVSSSKMKYYYIKTSEYIKMADDLFTKRIEFIRSLGIYSKQSPKKTEL